MNKKQFKIYTASAGSGKTYTLVKEFLTLSLSSDYPSCKDILAVTFTNKAANEMKAKILFYLDGFIANNPKCESMKNDVIKALGIDETILVERSVALYDNILHNYSDFNISTIDSFVQQVARGFAKELNLPVQYKVLIDDDDLLDGLIQSIDSQIDKDDDSITEILTEFVEFQLDEEKSLRIDALLRDFVAKLLKESAYKKGEILNISMKEFSGDEYLKIKKYLNALYHKNKQEVIDGVKVIRDLEDEYGIETTDYFNGKNGLQSILRKIEKDINVKSSSLLGATIRSIFNGDKNWYAAKGNKQAIADINRSGVDIVGLYKNLVKDHAENFLVNIVRNNLYLYALRSMLLNIINQHTDDTNKVHLSEFNKRISDILGDCSIPFIYEKIGSRYKHFFIDEFQDTSLLQWHNFLPLVNDGLSEGNMSLLVGDAKQAIYRFRNGEVEQIMKLPSIYGAEKNDFYTECENTFNENFQKESLEYNFRSKKNIIDFNNSFFKLSKYRLTSEAYRSVYDDLKQKCPKQHSYEGFVSVEIFDMAKFSENEIEKPTKLYKDAVKQSMLDDICALKDKGFSLSDIAILVRSNSDGSDIADFLSKNNIPVVSSDSILLKSSDKVRLVIYTLRCLVDDKNDVSKLALSFYRNICADADPYDIQKALKDSLNIDEIYDLRNKSYSLYDLCCSIIKMYKFNIIEDEFLQYFMNHVLEWQNNENKGIEAFIEHWDKKSGSLNVKISAEIDAVQIMTIHKSKGLEFKVVMYPYAYTKVPGDFKGGEKWLSLADYEVLKDIPEVDSFILPINKDTLVGTDMECHYVEEVEKAAFDDFNIMYVAMTRPADLMFIYTNCDGKADEEEKSSDSYNFFADYFDTDDADEEDMDLIHNRFNRVSYDRSVKHELGEIAFFEDKEDGDAKEIIELADGDVPQSKEWMKSISIEPDPTMFWAEGGGDYLPQEWGNLVHDILSKINTIEDADNVLRNYVNDGCVDEQQAELLRKQFESIVSIKEIRDAYSKDAIIRNEMDILIYDRFDGNKILRPDRYAELSDKVILIDYKTGKHHEQYYEQLKDYVVALKDMGVEKDIEAYLLYLGENIEMERVFLDRLF